MWASSFIRGTLLPMIILCAAVGCSKVLDFDSVDFSEAPEGPGSAGSAGQKGHAGAGGAAQDPDPDPDDSGDSKGGGNPGHGGSAGNGGDWGEAGAPNPGDSGNATDTGSATPPVVCDEGTKLFDDWAAPGSSCQDFVARMPELEKQMQDPFFGFTEEEIKALIQSDLKTACCDGAGGLEPD